MAGEERRGKKNTAQIVGVAEEKKLTAADDLRVLLSSEKEGAGTAEGQALLIVDEARIGWTTTMATTTRREGEREREKREERESTRRRVRL